MAKTYDLTNKLTNEKPIIKIGEVEIQVDNSKNTMFKADSETRKANSEVEIMDTVLSIFLGVKNKKKIDDMNLSISDYKTVYLAVMAAVAGEELEETESRFQKSQNNH